VASMAARRLSSRSHACASIGSSAINASTWLAAMPRRGSDLRTKQKKEKNPQMDPSINNAITTTQVSQDKANATKRSIFMALQNARNSVQMIIIVLEVVLKKPYLLNKWLRILNKQVPTKSRKISL